MTGVVVVMVMVVLAVVLACVALYRFAKWRHDAVTRARTGSTLARTARGPVEYAIEGSGAAVMVLHGGLGGFDQGLVMGRDLGVHESFTLLAPSRAGYLRTPLETCRTPAETADALAALLDELKIADVAVVGISGGGHTALQFALRQPDRTRALVMIAALSRRYVPPELTNRGIGRLLFTKGGLWFVDLFCWLLFAQGVRFFPGLVAARFFKASELLDAAAIRQRVRQLVRDPEQVRWLRQLVDYIFPISFRKTGLNNDLEQFERVTDYPVHDITCPTLVVHGRYDGNVPIEHAEYVANGVPDADFYIVQGCGHLVWLSEHAGRVRSRIMDFLNGPDVQPGQ